MARACIFCSGGPITVEDVFPHWITARFQAVSVIATRGDLPPFRQQQVELRAARVCKTCNNGWMNNLENRARPWLLSMVDGEPTALNPEAQAAMAAWAIKTAMGFEYTLGSQPDEIYWSSEERAQFRVPPHVPPGGDVTRVSLGAYHGNRLAFGQAHPTGGVRDIGDPSLTAPAMRATIVLGRLVLQVRTNRWRQTHGDEMWVWPVRHEGRTITVWPVSQREFQWPSAAPLNDVELREFATAEV